MGEVASTAVGYHPDLVDRRCSIAYESPKAARLRAVAEYAPLAAAPRVPDQPAQQTPDKLGFRGFVRAISALPGQRRARRAAARDNRFRLEKAAVRGSSMPARGECFQ
jgi:hypothetical protein